MEVQFELFNQILTIELNRKRHLRGGNVVVVVVGAIHNEIILKEKQKQIRR